MRKVIECARAARPCCSVASTLCEWVIWMSYISYEWVKCHANELCVSQVVLRMSAVCCSVLQCVAVCCSVLQCVAVCCSVLQCVAVCCSVLQSSRLENVCSVLQCVAVCCNVLQCVAVCCSQVVLRMSGCCSGASALCVSESYKCETGARHARIPLPAPLPFLYLLHSYPIRWVKILYQCQGNQMRACRAPKWVMTFENMYLLQCNEGLALLLAL